MTIKVGGGDGSNGPGARAARTMRMCSLDARRGDHRCHPHHLIFIKQYYLILVLSIIWISLIGHGVSHVADEGKEISREQKKVL